MMIGLFITFPNGVNLMITERMLYQHIIRMSQITLISVVPYVVFQRI